VTHPIETESYRLLEARVDLTHLAPGPRAVVARVIHATADLDFLDTLRLTETAVEAGLDALAAGAPVIVDVEMVRAGIGGVPTECFLGRARVARPDIGPVGTLSALAMRLAGMEHPDGAVFVVGCAPTALEQLLDLIEAGSVTPALVIGVPVGFVGAAEAKDRLQRATGVESISNVGERGGSSVAAAVVNALVRLRSSEPADADDQSL
jgi:precorrin-8X/cobalt-precorrin-8 methylmutase